MRYVFAILAALLAPFAQAQSVQVLGDSVLVWNSWADASVVDHLEQAFDGRVLNNAAAGAQMRNDNPLARLFGGEVGAQYENVGSDWIVLNGGVNDLVGHCGCDACAEVMDNLSSADGRMGAMPDLVNEIRDTGSQVVLLGYYAFPEGSDWAMCSDDLVELRARYTAIAERDVDVYFLDMGGILPRDQTELFDDDGIRPSLSGSSVIADGIVTLIQTN